MHYEKPESLHFAQIHELLAENIVFNSPILARSIEGREVCAAIFIQSSATRGTVRTYPSLSSMSAPRFYVGRHDGWPQVRELGDYRRQ